MLVQQELAGMVEAAGMDRRPYNYGHLLRRVRLERQELAVVVAAATELTALVGFVVLLVEAVVAVAMVVILRIVGLTAHQLELTKAVDLVEIVLMLEDKVKAVFAMAHLYIAGAGLLQVAEVEVVAEAVLILAAIPRSMVVAVGVAVAVAVVAFSMRVELETLLVQLTQQRIRAAL
jgi:hypothetical protein